MRYTNRRTRSLVMCLPVRQKPVLYRNDWTSRAGFGHGNYIISVLHCIMKKFGYLFSVLNALLTHWRRRPPSHANRFGARRPSTPSVRTQLKATFLSLLSFSPPELCLKLWHPSKTRRRSIKLVDRICDGRRVVSGRA